MADHGTAIVRPAESRGRIGVWLRHGGTDRGRERSRSGVLIAVPPTLDELVELREKLQRSLQFDDIDLVVLNEASPMTRYEAVSDRLVFARNREEEADFVSLTAREYEDSMALIRRGVLWRSGA